MGWPVGAKALCQSQNGAPAWRCWRRTLERARTFRVHFLGAWISSCCGAEAWVAGLIGRSSILRRTLKWTGGPGFVCSLLAAWYSMKPSCQGPRAQRDDPHGAHTPQLPGKARVQGHRPRCHSLRPQLQLRVPRDTPLQAKPQLPSPAHPSRAASPPPASVDSPRGLGLACLTFPSMTQGSGRGEARAAGRRDGGNSPSLALQHPQAQLSKFFHLLSVCWHCPGLSAPLKRAGL